MKKIMMGLLLAVIISTNVMLPVYAVDISEVINASTTTDIDSDVDELRGKAIGVMQVIGIAVASIMLVVVAIYYIISAPNDRAEIKKYIIPFTIGAVFIFASVGIVELVKNFAEGMF